MKRPALGLLVIVAICLDVLLASALPKKDSSKSASQLSSKETVSKEKLSAAKKPFGYTQFGESDPEYWYGMAAADLRERLDILRPLHKKAKNVVFFLGDGMGISTITASRIFKGQLAGHRGEEGYLEFDRFPYSAFIKTYNLDKQVPDSAGTATAYLTGVKANYGTIGVSSKVNQQTMDCHLINSSSVSSILQWALDAGKSAGVVTTTRITHATPAASYAHVPDRDWEGSAPEELANQPGCKDIAKQLVEEYPGNRLSVILGGGRREFIPKGQFDPKGTVVRGKLVPVEGNRVDGRNLIQEWIKSKSAVLAPDEFAYVNSTSSLKAIDYTRTRSLLGLFNHSHMEYDQLRDKSPNGEPSLTEMTEAAIRILRNQPGNRGFVLLVEGGRIDHAHHDGYSNLAMYETVEFDRAIRRAREMLPADETLFLATADHSHGLTINGYPNRGNPINGWVGEDADGIPYTTLMYATGPGHMSHEERERSATFNTEYFKFRPLAATSHDSAQHAGEDVGVFATGPMAHFFGGTHEQSYIAHVVGYAACIGVYRNESHCSPENGGYQGGYGGRRTEQGGNKEWENEIVIKEPGHTLASSRSLRLTKPKSGSASNVNQLQTALQVFTLILSTSWILVTY
ncbi:hypothetical protein TYRP_019141 [Tyrophagus putrescentiae]|nr:hypothetical protein TYRP_019141 [Tyrophagus putrescentiae]